MNTYLNWDTKKITDVTPAALDSFYNEGYVATRVEKGVMNRTRSFRIRLADFELTSENRRIMRKNEHLTLEAHPLPYKDYHWSIHKLAKDFYTTKFGEDTFSANKIKELMTEPNKSNFNTVLVFKNVPASVPDTTAVATTAPIGYCIALQTEHLLHYSYPFYEQRPETPSVGLGMMIQAILYAKQLGLEYIYLGSLQRPADTYKLQFEGQEWFDGQVWQKDISPLKDILKN